MDNFFTDEHVMLEVLALLKLLLAAVCGAVIGWEREFHEKGAGLRTHMLICLGSCLFTVTAVRMTNDFGGADVTRVVQGLLMAVGFISGGVIFTRGISVHGLTTATGLWVLTGVGLAIGVGYYWLAVMSTVFAFITITFLKRIERSMKQVLGKKPGNDVPPPPVA